MKLKKKDKCMLNIGDYYNMAYIQNIKVAASWHDPKDKGIPPSNYTKGIQKILDTQLATTYLKRP